VREVARPIVIAPELQAQTEGRESWIADQQRDNMLSAAVAVEPTLTSDTTATATIERLDTDAEGSGCNTWSGSYGLAQIYGEWRISEAALTRSEC
jgi:heat shock protein HslJ